MIRIHYSSWWQALGIQYINMKKCLDGQIINFGIYKIKVMNKYSIIQMGEISYYFNQFSIWPLYYVIPQDPQITHLNASIDPWLILGYIFVGTPRNYIAWISIYMRNMACMVCYIGNHHECLHAFARIPLSKDIFIQ